MDIAFTLRRPNDEAGRQILSTIYPFHPGDFNIVFVINLALISLFLLTVHLIGVKSSGFPIEHFASLIEKKDDIIAADSEVQDILTQTDTWAMLLDDNGTVIWQNNLPKELPLEYSATDIAIFSKWYLDDYPVKVWKHPDGLLVIGFQPGYKGSLPFFSENVLSFTLQFLVLSVP